MSLKGNAGFRFTPSGQSTKTHVLNFPMKLDVAPSHRKRRFAVDSLDLSSREVITIAPGRAEVIATLRFNKKSQDLLDVLELAADGLTLSYYPDLGVDTSYDLWLIEPSGDEIALARDQARHGFGEYQIRTRWRDASDSGQSLEALFSPWLFRYDAGMVVGDATFSRSGTARQIGQFGVLEEVADGVMRDGHWPLVDGEREVALLLEAARTNSVLQSEDFSHVSWSSEGTPVVTANDAVAPDGTTTADLIQDDDGAGFEGKLQDVTVADDSLTRVVSVFVRKQASFSSTVELEVEYRVGTSKAGQIQLNPATGATALRNSGNIAASGVEDVGDWYRLWLSVANNGTGNTTLRARVRPAINTSGADSTATSAATGSAHFWGAQVEGVSGGVVTPSSYVPTTTAAVTRSAETFYAPFLHAPQEMTVYAKFVERGNAAAANNLRLLQIGAATGTADPRFNVYCNTGGDYVVEHDNGTTVVGSVIGSGPSYGDVVEIRAVMNADGSVTGGQSINSGAEATNSNATTATLGSAWADTRLYLNSRGTSDRGLADFLSVKIAAGTKSLTKMRAL